jgi:dTDP-4-amino-4,6-dideoxygalactose transaminase
MIPHSKTLIHSDDIRAVAAVVESGMLVGGGKVPVFERALAAFIGLPHAAAASSGTAALYLALRALGVGGGDEVAIPAYVCTALLHAVMMTGAEPALADTGGDGVHMDAGAVRRALSARTKAVVFPHLFGAACDIGDIVALGVPVIEDCAMSLGAERCGVKAGNLGSAAAMFSFYATKVIAAGEGGMVLSSDRALVERVRDLSDYADKLDGILRFNFAMTDMTAALGLSQLERLPSMIARRRELASRYSAAFADTDLELPAEKKGERHIFYRYVVESDRTEALRMSLRERGIMAERPVAAPLSRITGMAVECPGAERAWKRSLSLPLYPALSDAEAETVIRAVREIFLSSGPTR